MAFEKNLLLCTPIECSSVEQSVASMDEAKAEGGDLVELHIDSTSSFSLIHKLLNHRSLPSILSLSIGIPHKEAVLECCDEIDPLAKAIGAVNSIIRRESDGKLIGYNTDCEDCITAIEDALSAMHGTNGGVSRRGSSMAGKIFILVGAGGAGRALAFGAKSRGARVVVFNRNFERAKALADAVSREALPYEYLETFSPKRGMILANASAIGMESNVPETPIPKESLQAYELVFNAVYTLKNTRLLREAAEVGAIVVSGLEMFIRQAFGQFRLFAGGPAPEVYMRKLVENNFKIGYSLSREEDTKYTKTIQ